MIPGWSSDVLAPIYVSASLWETFIQKNTAVNSWLSHSHILNHRFVYALPCYRDKMIQHWGQGRDEEEEEQEEEEDEDPLGVEILDPNDASYIPTEDSIVTYHTSMKENLW